MQRFMIGLLVFLVLSFLLPYIGIASQLQSYADSVNPHALPFVYIFHSINILMSPYSSLIQKSPVASPGLITTLPLSWAPLAILLLASFTSGAITGGVGKSFKLSTTCVLILMILWLPASFIALEVFISDEVYRTLLLDRMIADFILHRQMDVVLVFLAPMISAALGAAVFGKFGHNETEIQSTEWVISE